MDDRTKNWHAAMERAVERFQEERAQWPEGSNGPEPPPATEPRATADDADAISAFADRGSSAVDVREVDERVLEDLASKYSDVKCPVHGEAPKFDVEGGSVREWFCCDTLLRIVRELSARDAA